MATVKVYHFEFITLTADAVGKMYSERVLKDPVYVQVLYCATNDNRCYFRFVDGYLVSPIAIIDKDVFKGDFGFGDVIAIHGFELRPDGTPEWKHVMEDNGIHHLYITKYTVAAQHTEHEGILGKYPMEFAKYYRQALALINIQMRKKCPRDFFAIYTEDQKKIEERSFYTTLNKYHGNILYKMQNYQGAVDRYEIAKRSDIYEHSLWSNCSQAYLKSGDYEDAEFQSIMALRMNPFDEKSYVRLIQIALAQGKKEKALEYAGLAQYMFQHENDYLDDYLDLVFPDLNITSYKSLKMLKPFEVTRVGEFYRVAYAEKRKKVTYSGPHFAELEDAFNAVEIPNKEWEFIIIPLDTSTGCGKNTKEDFMKLLEVESLRLNNKKMEKRQKQEKEEILEQIKGIRAEQKKRKAQEPVEKRRGNKMRKEGIKMRIQMEQNRIKEHMEKERQPAQRKTSPVKSPHKQEKKSENNIQEYMEIGRRYLSDCCYRQAIMVFEKCLELCRSDKSQDHKEIHFVTAMCEIEAGKGSVVDGMDVMKILTKDVKFAPAAKYWLAQGYVKICMFQVGMKHAESCLEDLKNFNEDMIKKWPGTEDVIVQTTSDYLKQRCNTLIEKLSSEQPLPIAKCHLKKCEKTQGTNFAKKEIFIQDFEFKGYVTVECEENCCISFHPVCWKAMKEQGKPLRKTDKEYLGTECFTPDCTGFVCSITIYDNNNDIKSNIGREKRRNEVPVKEKKKKDKKPEKTPQVRDKKKEKKSENKENTPADQSTTVSKEPQPTHTSEKLPPEKEETSKVSSLPIDPESLEWTKVTVLKPSAEEEEISKPKSVKKKKKKKEKALPQADLLGNPLDAGENVENEYIARLKLLKQKKEEGMMSAPQLRKLRQRMKILEQNNAEQKEKAEEAKNLNELLSELDIVAPFDPENPFFLPENLRQNDTELEKYLKELKTGPSASVPASRVVPCYDGDIHAGLNGSGQRPGRYTNSESSEGSNAEPEGAVSLNTAEATLDKYEEININKICSICLDPMENSKSETLECNHKFHSHCIKRWLKVQSNCPNCRQFALTQEDFPRLRDARHWISVQPSQR